MKRTATRRPRVYPWHHCNVKITSPCRILAYSEFSGNLFHVCYQYKMRYSVLSKKRIHYSLEGGIEWSPFVIFLQASWRQLVILGLDFSISPSHSWYILILHIFIKKFSFLQPKILHLIVKFSRVLYYSYLGKLGHQIKSDSDLVCFIFRLR